MKRFCCCFASSTSLSGFRFGSHPFAAFGLMVKYFSGSKWLWCSEIAAGVFVSIRGLQGPGWRLICLEAAVLMLSWSLRFDFCILILWRWLIVSWMEEKNIGGGYIPGQLFCRVSGCSLTPGSFVYGYTLNIFHLIHCSVKLLAKYCFFWTNVYRLYRLVHFTLGIHENFTFLLIKERGEGGWGYHRHNPSKQPFPTQKKDYPLMRPSWSVYMCI